MNDATNTDRQPDFSKCWECGESNTWDAQPCQKCFEAGLKQSAGVKCRRPVSREEMLRNLKLIIQDVKKA